MATIEKIDEITSLIRAMENVQTDTDVIRYQRELINREMDTLNEAVKFQKAHNDRMKEMVESVKGILNNEKEKDEVISACKSKFARGSSERLLWFAGAQVKKSKMTHDLKQIEVDKKIQKCIDEYADKNPQYRELKQKEMRFVKLQDDVKKKKEAIVRLENFIARENTVEDMMLQENIIGLARSMVEYHKNTTKSVPESTSIAHLNIPMNKKSTSFAQHIVPMSEESTSDAQYINEDEQLNSFKKRAISDSSVNDISVFKMPCNRRGVKRKPAETCEEPSPAMSFKEKSKLPTVAKQTKEQSKAPYQLMSILKRKEVKTIEMSHTDANMRQLRESEESSIQKNHRNVVPENHDSNLSSLLEHSEKTTPQKQSKSKTVTFTDLNSSIESDIVPLSGTSQNKPTYNLKSTSNTNIAMESPNGSDCSDFETNEENVPKEQRNDENMELISDTSSIEQLTPLFEPIANIAMKSPSGSNGSDNKTNNKNIPKDRCLNKDAGLSSNSFTIEQDAPMSKPIERTAKDANLETLPRTTSLNLNFNDPKLLAQFTTPKSKRGSTDAHFDNANNSPVSDLDFDCQFSQDFQISPNFQATSNPDSNFNFMNFHETETDFSSLFK